MNKDFNEMDFRAFFKLIWVYKFLILFTCVFTIFLGGFYIGSVKNKYTSISSFKMNQEKINASNGSPDLTLITAIAGVGFSEEKFISLEMFFGRVFVQKLNEKIDLYGDPFFNSYNIKSNDPYWKEIIKRLIRKQSTDYDVEELKWNAILASFRKNVKLVESDGGEIKIYSTHSDANRAADIANIIMTTLLEDQKIAIDGERRSQLDYLTSTLASALTDLELSQERLKKFTIDNSSVPLEVFGASSVFLEKKREDLIVSNDLLNAVRELNLILKNNSMVTKNDYIILQKKYPIIDQLDFRRIMGISENISSWTWPKKKSALKVGKTLEDRVKMLRSEIELAEKNTERYGKNLETFSNLKRNVSIAEATYTVLIEQVKAQSVAAGFVLDNSLVYEFARPPNSASTPNPKHILLISAFVGLIIGIALAIILYMQRKVYISTETIISDVMPQFACKMDSLKFMQKSKLIILRNKIPKKYLPKLRDLAVEINKSTSPVVVFTSTHHSRRSINLARLLASYMQSIDTKIAIINFSQKQRPENLQETTPENASYYQYEKHENLSILIPKYEQGPLEFLSKIEFSKSIKSLVSSYDLVFMCAGELDSVSLLRSLQGQKAFHIVNAKVLKTKYKDLEQMSSHLTIQGLIHD
jgi:uncharacterized protein involved in exopolysaccharide biosynthesis